MDPLLLACDRLSIAVGRLFGWFIVLLVALITFEVVARYAFGSPHAWAPDLAIMGFGAFFMMGGAYTLAQQNHVRGDILYGMLAPRTQATIDLLLYVLFFAPGVIALVWAGYTFAAESWAIGERSGSGSGGPYLFPLKALIPAAGGLLLLQGLAEAIRCVVCIRTGAWPPRRGDVQEVDVDKMRAQLDLPETQGATR